MSSVDFERQRVLKAASEIDELKEIGTSTKQKLKEKVSHTTEYLDALLDFRLRA